MLREEQIRCHEVNFEERRKFEFQVQIFQVKNEENFKFFQNKERWKFWRKKKREIKKNEENKSHRRKKICSS